MKKLQIEIEYLKTPQIQVFPEPNLLFKVGQRSTINNALIGIQNHGPYDYNLNLRTFDSIKFIVIHNNDKDLQIKTLHLLNKLISRQGYYKGFKTNFRLTEVKIPESTDEFLIYNSQNDNILFDLNQKYPITAKKRGQIYFVIIVGNDHRAIENTNEYYYLKRFVLKMVILANIFLIIKVQITQVYFKKCLIQEGYLTHSGILVLQFILNRGYSLGFKQSYTYKY